METITKRAKRPALSEMGERILAQYERRLCIEEDLTATTVRNYLSDLRHFISWCEITWKRGREEDPAFTPEGITTPTITDYRTYLQLILHLKPNSVNRSLISLKRYFAWLLSTGHDTLLSRSLATQANASRKVWLTHAKQAPRERNIFLTREMEV